MSTFTAREADWRNGAIVYQVLVDRFAPPDAGVDKTELYPPPKRLRRWDERPTRGPYLPELRLWRHEIDFWGGDLASLRGRLDHVQQLGADVLYLNPIHLAFTNHKYDALDHRALSPEFGTRDDVIALADELHRRGLRLVLDGVFNHMGRQAPIFRAAEADPQSPWRDWFHFGPQYPGGTRSWWLAENLPELNLENPAVREHLFNGPDSVVRRFLRDGADGWRLDVAVDLGYAFLHELTQAAHDEKPGALVVGEIANYPSAWFPAVDAVMNFPLREIILRLAAGRLEAPTAQRMIERLVGDAGIEPLLKSWLMLDNHDTPRLATVLPAEPRRRLAQALQFTLPGAPNLYYGSELGMTGGDDPAMRAPMRWDLVRDDNRALQWTRQLVALRRAHRALRIGEFRPLTTTRLLGFERHTDRVRDTVLVLANPGDEAVNETVLVANSSLMNAKRLLNLLEPDRPPLVMNAALLDVSLPPQGLLLLAPETDPPGGYSAYKRVP
ncbi:glycoside hydrolase family 13 protein [Aquabacterium sp.]|uniref:glycoside hydrolase family 13 protein n=1 Tax=Aquabacterium sp. TaxID=1872578 RepID=UPI0037830235